MPNCESASVFVESSADFKNQNNEELDGTLYLPFDNLGSAFYSAENLLKANPTLKKITIILLSKNFELSKDILISASYTQNAN